MGKNLFYALSLTWGLPLTLLGGIAYIVLRIAGHKPQHHIGSHCTYFTIGKDWGGLNLGVVVITQENPSQRTIYHEFGHALQNCVYGPLMIPLVCIPSVTRYWYRKAKQAKGKLLKPYDAVWFERQATAWGIKMKILHGVKSEREEE